MLKLLISLYSKHRNNKIILFLKKIYMKEFAFPYDYFAAFRLFRIKKKEKNPNRNIRIGFIVQDPNTWSKMKRLYIAMKKHNKFDVFLICVPSPFDDDSGSTYDFLNLDTQDCIDARIGEGPWNIFKNQGKWFDIKSLNLDYIYYGQPYNNYLPKPYQNTVTSKYTRVCIMTYGMTVSWNFLKMHPRYFHRYVYCCYAATSEELIFNQKRFPLFYKHNLQKTKYLGFPAFDDIFECRDDEAPSWQFSRNEFRAIWTPRWATEKNLGGSNFFRYKDVLFNYASVHTDSDFLFRPHPMALDNFQETGEMTAEEVLEFKNKCATMCNINLDIQKDYNATMWKSSVLISDISTIIVEYFITGKPIIFCNTLGSEQNYLDYFSKILSCCYIANNENELCEILTKLRSNDDPLKEKRLNMIDEIFGNILYGSTDRIIQDFLNDYYG